MKSKSYEGWSLGRILAHREAQRRRNPRLNQISALAYEMVGGVRFFYNMPKEARLECRRIAAEHVDARRRFENAVELANTRILPKSGFVYVISHPAFPGYVKIGSACDVTNRVNQLRTSYPTGHTKIHYAELCEDRHAVERRAHQIMAPYRADGEWFRVDAVSACEAVLIAELEIRHEQRAAA